MISSSAARARRFTLSWLGNAVAVLALCALAVVSARTQVEGWQWIAPGRGQWWLAAALVAAYVGFVAAVAVSRKRSARRDALPELHADRRGEWLVAFASQTGAAERIDQLAAKSGSPGPSRRGCRQRKNSRQPTN